MDASPRNTRHCPLLLKSLREHEQWQEMEKDGTLWRKLLSTGLRLIRIPMSGSASEHLMSDPEPQQLLKHVCTSPVIHVPTAVADWFGWNFVTRTLPCVRFIVYRPHKFFLQTQLNTQIEIFRLISFSDQPFPSNSIIYRLIRATACRLVQEEDTVQLYYSTENTREFKEIEEQSLEVVSAEDRNLTTVGKIGFQVGVELAPAVEHLIGSYPKWTKVEELPVDELEDRMKVMVNFIFCHFLFLTPVAGGGRSLGARDSDDQRAPWSPLWWSLKNCTFPSYDMIYWHMYTFKFIQIMCCQKPKLSDPNSFPKCHLVVRRSRAPPWARYETLGITMIWRLRISRCQFIFVGLWSSEGTSWVVWRAKKQFFSIETAHWWLNKFESCFLDEVPSKDQSPTQFFFWQKLLLCQTQSYL